MNCRICSAVVVPYVKKNGYDVFQCKHCGFGQTDVTQDEISNFYDKAYFDGEKAHFGQPENDPIRPTHRFWIEQQLAHLPNNQPLNVLEIGPGLGGPIAGYIQHEYPNVNYAAIEISEYASERLRARGLTIYNGRVVDPDILEACRGKYDLVFGTEVIEHDLQPHQFVSAVHDMLKPGGRAAFTTGNLRGFMSRWNKEKWYYLDPPAHVSFYTPKAVRHVFAASGFCNIRAMRYGFNHIGVKLKTHVPGLLLLTHFANISTGMTISAHRQ
jgi:2-polyprenyl-3-methyl-5-hydroxy-6-metoxy-1,4-benzoquinol methylase